MSSVIFQKQFIHKKSHFYSEIVFIHELVTELSLISMHSTELPAVLWPHGATNLLSGIA